MPGWTSGAIGVFDDVSGVEDKLKNFKLILEDEDLRTEKKFKLTNFVRLDGRHTRLTKNSYVISGVVQHEYISTPRRIEPNESGEYHIVDGDPYVDTKFGRFWITTSSIAIADRTNTREFTFEVLSAALKTRIKPAKFRIAQLATDHEHHWLGSFHDRQGRMQSGTIYGDSVEDEKLIRREYPSWKKNQVGFEATILEAPVKVKVTRDGIVVIYRDLYEDIGQYVRFIKDELMPYLEP